MLENDTKRQPKAVRLSHIIPKENMQNILAQEHYKRRPIFNSRTERPSHNN